MTVPNFLTFLRIALTPLICLAISHSGDQGSYMAFYLFMGAGLTDFADGYVACKMNARSALGAILDPLADKILVIVILFFLVAYKKTIGGLIVWPSALIIVREIVVLGMRSLYGAHRFPVVSLARGKTFLQFLSIGLFLFPTSLVWPEYLAQGLLWSSVIVSLASGYWYLHKAIDYGMEEIRS